MQNTPGFGTLLDELRESWRVDAVIHNDMKWDNCLVLPAKSLNAEPILKIVDWEFANLGDSCWDVGAVFSGFLSSWVLSVPTSGEESAAISLNLRKFRLPACIQRFACFGKRTAMADDLAKSNLAIFFCVPCALARHGCCRPRLSRCKALPF